MRIGLPARFEDVSAFRQVPDTQEVFVDVRTDQSVIVEILEMVPDATATGQGAADFHFNSLAHDNDALESHIEQRDQLRPLPFNGERSVSIGVQRVAKFNEAAERANQVRVHVACFRFPHVSTDIVVSWNQPIEINASSSSAEAVDAAALAQNGDALSLFQPMIESFAVLDWSIFQG